MTALDLEAEYNNRRRVPEYLEINKRWHAESERVRKEISCELDLSYGPKERNRYDLFHPAGGAKDAPVTVYIHGGYWQRGDRKEYSFVARELTALGLSVAIPSYSLCPAVTVIDIIDEMRACIQALYAKTKRRPVVFGLSAGGHLTAAMLATDWSKYAGVPADLVRAGYAISGIYDLPPLIATSINDALKMTEATAKAASPILWPAPRQGGFLTAAVGALESQEFIRQALDLAGTWSRSGLAAECVVVSGTNHFTVLDEVARPGSAMSVRIAGLARDFA